MKDSMWKGWVPFKLRSYHFCYAAYEGISLLYKNEQTIRGYYSSLHSVMKCQSSFIRAPTLNKGTSIKISLISACLLSDAKYKSYYCNMQ